MCPQLCVDRLSRRMLCSVCCYPLVREVGQSLHTARAQPLEKREERSLSPRRSVITFRTPSTARVIVNSPPEVDPRGPARAHAGNPNPYRPRPRPRPRPHPRPHPHPRRARRAAAYTAVLFCPPASIWYSSRSSPWRGHGSRGGSWSTLWISGARSPPAAVVGSRMA